MKTFSMRKLCHSREGLARSFLGLIFLFLLMPYPAAAYHGEDKKPARSFSDSFKEAGENFVDVLPDDARYFFGSILDDVVDLAKLPTEENEITVKKILAGTVLLGTIPATIYGLTIPYGAISAI